MINNKIIRQVILADKNGEQVSITQRRIAATGLINRSLLMFIIFICTLSFGFSFILLDVLAIISLFNAIKDYGKYRFQTRVIRIYDCWHREYLDLLR